MSFVLLQVIAMPLYLPSQHGIGKCCDVVRIERDVDAPCGVLVAVATAGLARHRHHLSEGFGECCDCPYAVAPGAEEGVGPRASAVVVGVNLGTDCRPEILPLDYEGHGRGHGQTPPETWNAWTLGQRPVRIWL